MARANGYGAGTPGGGQGYSNYNSPVNGAGGNAPITNGKNGNTFGINAGALGTTLGGYNAFTNQQLGMAGQAGSGVPGYLSNAFGAASGASNANLGGFNNLAGSAINNANNLINSAGGNFNSAYNTSLNSQLQALNPAIQQQSNALLNSQFERGQAGTSGGALQTQALQNSFNQATLQAQNNALGQANSIMGTTYNAANTSAGIGQNAGAYGINATNNNLNNMFRYATAPATIASPYLANANQSTAGYGATNNDVNANANMSLNLMKLQADAAGNAARTAGGIATAPNFQTSGASTWGNLGNSLFGNSNSSGNYGGTLGNIFNKLFGNSNNSNDSNLNDISNGTGSYTPTNNGPMSDSTINSMIDGNSSLFSSPTAFDPSQNGIDPNAGWSA
jgi:hypothetical protein